MALALVQLAGCGPVDRFGDRATQYNVEVENTRSQVVLLNILRSAYRKPTQFSDLSTVTGTAGVSGGIGTTFPLAGPASGYQINPTLSYSGGPSFTVGTTNTREFYSALLAQVPTRQIAIYIQEGRPRKVLLTILVSRLVIKSDGVVTYSVPNTFANPADFETFQSLLDDLIDAGLTVKPSKTFEPIGPPLPVASIRQTDALAALVDKGLELRENKSTKGPSTYQVGRSSVDYVFCFDPDLKKAESKLNPRLTRDQACGGSRADEPSGKENSLRLEVRSTDGVITFLGEIARAELGLGKEVFYPHLAFPVRGKPPEMDILFRIATGAGEKSLSVNYEGAQYRVTSDPAGRDHSGEMIKLVEELIALNSSAKDLPAPNAITLIGR